MICSTVCFVFFIDDFPFIDRKSSHRQWTNSQGSGQIEYEHTQHPNTDDEENS